MRLCGVSEIPDLRVEAIYLTGSLDELIPRPVGEHVLRSVQHLFRCNGSQI